jgi:peptidoglycan hydrolase CwlO-like protein
LIVSNIFAELHHLSDNIATLEQRVHSFENAHKDLDEDLDKLLARVSHLENVTESNHAQLRFLVSAVTKIYQLLEPPKFSETTGVSVQVLP